MLLLLAGCVSSVPVAIENASDKPLRHVVVSGAGFSESVESIGPGNTETVFVRPRHETTVTVAFDVDGENYSAQSAEDSLIDNDDVNRVDVKVEADLTIDMNVGLR